ncbi:MAG TPA: pore-forming ESAT-6 family protein [Mycobacteriales bacterium]|nr:pore-forming ESAT-6 family protein [Mycobacteriales bacterium]
MPNQMDRRSFDVAASGSAQELFNTSASRLEALIDQRDADVRTAMADYEAEGVSDSYQGKEMRWHSVASEVRTIIATLRASLGQNDESARQAMQRAQSAVDSIG